MIMIHTALLHLYSSLSSFDFADTPTYLDKNSTLKGTYTVNVYPQAINRIFCDKNKIGSTIKP